MKAVLVYWHRARLRERYLLEMKIHRVGRSKKYRGGVKYGLILVDERSGKRVLMDNHHPKGPHVHVDDKEFPYRYVDESRLIEDFRALVLEYMGVKI